MDKQLFIQKVNLVLLDPKHTITILKKKFMKMIYNNPSTSSWFIHRLHEPKHNVVAPLKDFQTVVQQIFVGKKIEAYINKVDTYIPSKLLKVHGYANNTAILDLYKNPYMEKSNRAIQFAILSNPMELQPSVDLLYNNIKNKIGVFFNLHQDKKLHNQVNSIITQLGKSPSKFKINLDSNALIVVLFLFVIVFDKHTHSTDLYKELYHEFINNKTPKKTTLKIARLLQRLMNKDKMPFALLKKEIKVVARRAYAKTRNPRTTTEHVIFFDRKAIIVRDAKTNKIKRVTHYKNGKNHGQEIMYSTKGKLIQSTTWVNGVEHGVQVILKPDIYNKTGGSYISRQWVNGKAGKMQRGFQKTLRFALNDKSMLECSRELKCASECKAKIANTNPTNDQLKQRFIKCSKCVNAYQKHSPEHPDKKTYKQFALSNLEELERRKAKVKNQEKKCNVSHLTTQLFDNIGKRGYLSHTIKGLTRKCTSEVAKTRLNQLRYFTDVMDADYELKKSIKHRDSDNDVKTKANVVQVSLGALKDFAVQLYGYNSPHKYFSNKYQREIPASGKFKYYLSKVITHLREINTRYNL